MTDCPRRDKRIRPCRFEPRYDVSAVDLPKDLETLKISDSSYLEKFRHKTYVGDVCITCGKTVYPRGVTPK